MSMRIRNKRILQSRDTNVSKNRKLSSKNSLVFDLEKDIAPSSYRKDHSGSDKKEGKFLNASRRVALNTDAVAIGLRTDSQEPLIRNKLSSESMGPDKQGELTMALDQDFQSRTPSGQKLRRRLQNDALEHETVLRKESVEQDSFGGCTESLNKRNLDRLQGMILERERIPVCCDHVFCRNFEKKLSSTEYRNLFLFELEMFPGVAWLETGNLRNVCYWDRVYLSIIPDWQVKCVLQDYGHELHEAFDVSQLIIEWSSSPPDLINRTVQESSFLSLDDVQVRIGESLDGSSVHFQRVIPPTVLSERLKANVFEEEIDTKELLKASSSSFSESLKEDSSFKHCASANHKKCHCILRKKLSPEEPVAVEKPGDLVFPKLM